MATDATGTPTPLGIPTYNVNADAPSGNGFNEAMAEIDTLIQERQLNPQIGSQASAVTASGSGTFASGTDVLASALSFTAVTGAKYRLRIVAADGSSSVANGGLHVNLDGADGGIFGLFGSSNIGMPLVAETILSPSSGAHTVNVRVVNGGSGTTTVTAGGSTTPIFVTLDRIA